MADYSIFVLDESDLDIVGAELDGGNQGSGIHLRGASLTILANNWTEIFITDDDDNFGDSDRSQRLDGAQEIDGTTYLNGSIVEAEYAFTVTDGTNSWTLVGFNVNNSSPAFGTVEGIAVASGPGGFPPVGVELTVTETFEGPNFAAADYITPTTPICFTAGTQIDTPAGPRRIETLVPGDLVCTLEHGAQPIRWIGQREVAAEGAFAPVLFKAGALGNTRDLKVSQRHRMLIRNWRAQLYTGHDAVLAAAVHLVNGRDIALCPGGTVTYLHLLFDDHQVICAEGAYSESLHPGKQALRALAPEARDEVLALFPELRSDADPRPLAATELRRHEVRVLA